MIRGGWGKVATALKAATFQLGIAPWRKPGAWREKSDNPVKYFNPQAPGFRHGAMERPLHTCSIDRLGDARE